VRNYKSGATPVVRYARRALCIACHQNAAPIFSRPLWGETPASPAIAARLRATQRDYYGVKISGTDIAYFIDTATDRANLFGVWQTIWRDGCGAGAAGAACRREWFDASMNYALSGVLPQSRLPLLQTRWPQQWPHGLAIPNPDIPNRDPLSADQPLPAADPLTPRAPLEVWTRPDPDRLVAGLASLFNPADVARLRPALHRQPRPDSAELDKLAASDAAFDSGQWIGALLPAAARRASPALPPPQTEAAAPARNLFERQCGQCHRTPDAFPPNFLFGNSARQEQGLGHCAERIFYRLTMGALPESQRGKPPMPPPSILAARGFTAHSWATSPALAALLADARRRLARRNVAPSAVLAQPYERLPVCLPPPSSQRMPHG
jgi:mono/diheme cytochrome c family protein